MARSQTCWSMVFPAIQASTFPGKREEPNRAGTTPRILPRTFDHNTNAARGRWLLAASHQQAWRCSGRASWTGNFDPESLRSRQPSAGMRKSLPDGFHGRFASASVEWSRGVRAAWHLLTEDMVQNKPAVRMPVAVEVIERRILLLRRHKVMLDSHLAELHEVESTRFWFKRCGQRNQSRFSGGFHVPITTRGALRRRKT